MKHWRYITCSRSYQCLHMLLHLAHRKMGTTKMFHSSYCIFIHATFILFNPDVK